MELNVNIKCDGLVDVLNRLCDTLGANVISNTIQTDSEVKPQEQKAKADEEPKRAEVKPIEPNSTEDAKVSTEPQSEETKEAAVTLEDVSTLAKQKAAAGKSAEVKGIIHRFNAQKISDIQPEHYTEVIAELEVL